jgi:hypothetical protein
MTDVIIESGPTVSERIRVGPLGELRFDTDNDTVRVHDGNEVGGYELLSRAVADSLYVTATPDLAALRSPASGALGFISRAGVGSYRHRSLTVDSNNLTIANPSGDAGNPLIALKTVITSAHTFNAITTFAGGLSGDLTGNVIGNLTGNVTGNLDGNVTGDVLGNLTGSLDARGKVLLVDDDSLPISAVSGLADALSGLVFSLPAGLIMLWSGSAASIPAGWALCDGQNGTPNLADRFVIGAGGTREPGDTGGATEHTHTATAADGGAHTHGITVAGHALTVSQLPPHTHSNGVVDSDASLFNRGSVAANPTRNDSIDNNNSNGIFEGVTSSTGSGATHSHSATSTSAGSHSHALTVAEQNNLPPFYALCYIMVTA